MRFERSFSGAGLSQTAGKEWSALFRIDTMFRSRFGRTLLAMNGKGKRCTALASRLPFLYIR